uniref:Chorismate synthase n=1 Tax=Rhizophora mucronata TaxID=61149 RepID=A0A2P2JEV6_RHIMU
MLPISFQSETTRTIGRAKTSASPCAFVMCAEEVAVICDSLLIFPGSVLHPGQIFG